MVVALFTLGNASNMFLLLRAKDMGFPEYQVPLLWALVSFTAALFSTPLSALSDKLGRVRLIVGGWVVYSVFYLLLGLNGHPLLVWPLFAFYGLFMAATEGAEKALVADMVPKEVLGTAYGWFNLTAGIMLLPASIIFGWLWQADKSADRFRVCRCLCPAGRFVVAGLGVAVVPPNELNALTHLPVHVVTGFPVEIFPDDIRID